LLKPPSGQILQFILRNREGDVTARSYTSRESSATNAQGRRRSITSTPPRLMRMIRVSPQKSGDLPGAREQEEGARGAQGRLHRVDAKAFLTRDPTELARLLSVTYFQNKRYREAISHGLAVLRETPRTAQVHVVVAESFRNLGELDKARNHYERAVEADKGNPDIQYGLSMVLFEQGSYPELNGVLQRIGRSLAGDQTVAYYMALASSRYGRRSPDHDRPAAGAASGRAAGSFPDARPGHGLSPGRHARLRGGLVPANTEVAEWATGRRSWTHRRAQGQENKDGLVEAYRTYS